MGKKSAPAEICNRKAFHRYIVLEKFEAGIVLRGTEVKSIRDGAAQISEAFVRIGRGGKPMLWGSDIEAYSHGTDANHLRTRLRELLLHGREIEQLKKAVDRKGFTIIPLRMYFKRGIVKVEIGLCRGKQLHDKRDSLREKTVRMEAARELSNSMRHRN
ncbi:MAG: SsrA-binding protein SmpB [Puniceicoccales bacterium]|jgi:SsrA-binding protein|nr:SsrA-binding protein SmpB [Puniceicoccales bacterium]